MANELNNSNDYAAIAELIQVYINGAKSGRGEDMQAAFHQYATVFGYAGDELFAGHIQKLFTWNDENGAAPELQSQLVSIDLNGSVATVHLELSNWTGNRFTDLFTLLKTEEEWKITSKAFHLHSIESS